MRGTPIRHIVLAAAVAAIGACSATRPPVAADPATSAGDSLLYPGERHLRNPRQLTFEGNNAEAYFSRDGRKLIFQRQVDGQNACDQQFVINVDGSGLRRVSNGAGRTTCGYFFDGDRRILYSSTHQHSPECPAPPDHSQGYVWPLGQFEIYAQRLDGTEQVQLTRNGAYNAEATVSPDGRRVIFTSTRDGDVELYTMNPGGSDVRRVLLPGRPANRLAGAVSRDLRRHCGLPAAPRPAPGPAEPARDLGGRRRRLEPPAGHDAGGCEFCSVLPS